MQSLTAKDAKGAKEGVLRVAKAAKHAKEGERRVAKDAKDTKGTIIGPRKLKRSIHEPLSAIRQIKAAKKTPRVVNPLSP